MSWPALAVTGLIGTAFAWWALSKVLDLLGSRDIDLFEDEDMGAPEGGRLPMDRDRGPGPGAKR